MPKRKRSGASSVSEKLERCRNEVARALKLAKAFERQRMNKRLHDDGIAAEKQERLNREIAVIKSLDLQQTARAHLYSSLIRVKSIAESTDLPEEVLTGVPKPELSEEEKVALHNVTSGLYNRENVKKAIDNAVAVVCEALGVPLPEKGKRVRKSKREGKEEQPSDRILQKSVEDDKPVATDTRERVDGDVSEETDFEGFESDLDVPGPVVGEPDSEEEVEEEERFSKYDHLLGSSDEEDEEAEDEDIYERFKGKEKVNLDDISDSGSEPAFGSESEASSDSSPPPQSKKQKVKKPSAPIGPVRDSTFLPSLMGGYISGSESASDIDVAPAKKRRGQRQRQAIAEKKFGASAKHLQNEKRGGRDSGWDMKRGAVDGEDEGRRTPWKRGVANPFGRGDARQELQKPDVVREKDDQGKLHPSWAAKKAAKESQKPTAFTGQKVVFD